MKKTYLFFLIFNISFMHAQVGIGTTNPTADFDINGTLRVRTTNTNLNESAAKDSILVSDNLGNIARISSKKVIESHLKTFIKGNFSSGSNVALSLTSNTSIIPFNITDFDTNSEFNNTTHVYSAKQDGIYSVYVQIRGSGLSVATNFGVQILKNGSVISQNSFANIGITIIGTINVTPPIRNSQTLVQLNTGDTIQFNVVSNLLNLSLLGTDEDCYFTIHQVR